MILTKKGDSVVIDGGQPWNVKLMWKTAVDFDLHFFAIPSTAEVPKKKGLAKLFSGKNTSPRVSHIYFSNKGNIGSFPFARLDQDSGVGNVVDAGGYNEENLTLHDPDKIGEGVICANIFSGSANFKNADAKVTISLGSEPTEVSLDSNKSGKWCVIARLKRVDGGLTVVNESAVQRDKPSL